MGWERLWDVKAKFGQHTRVPHTTQQLGGGIFYGGSPHRAAQLLPNRLRGAEVASEMDSPSCWNFCRCSLSLEMLGIFCRITKQKDPGRDYRQKRTFWGRFVGCLGFFHRTLLPRTFIREPLAKILLHWFLNNFRQTFSKRCSRPVLAGSERV